MAVERTNLRSLGRGTGMGVSDAVFRKESPPDDDVCPICFGDFDLPCRADCGHWFCGSCILQAWNFSSALQACKCPMCCRLIKSLKPYLSLQNPDEEEARKVLKSIVRYNRLFVGGPRGFVLLILGNLYLISPFMFIPKGVDLVTLCNISAILVVLFIMILGVFQRRRAAERVRRLAPPVKNSRPQLLRCIANYLLNEHKRTAFLQILIFSGICISGLSFLFEIEGGFNCTQCNGPSLLSKSYLLL